MGKNTISILVKKLKNNETNILSSLSWKNFKIKNPLLFYKKSPIPKDIGLNFKKNISTQLTEYYDSCLKLNFNSRH
jgi:hypothetical protein